MKSYCKESYRFLLRSALQRGYDFVGFRDYDIARKPFVILRHDVDYSINLAVELAQLNAECGVRGTFFVLLRSQVYNLLSYWSLTQIAKLRSLGQTIAFHCAVPRDVVIDEEELIGLVQRDYEIVKANIPDLEPVFAWHNTTPELLARSRPLQVPGLTNVYLSEFVEQMTYRSDTNLRYPVTEFDRELDPEVNPRMQLLFHPLNWVLGGNYMTEILSKAWIHIVREREEEMLVNRAYCQALPTGMPPEILDSFARAVKEAADR